MPLKKLLPPQDCQIRLRRLRSIFKNNRLIGPSPTSPTPAGPGDFEELPSVYYVVRVMKSFVKISPVEICIRESLAKVHAPGIDQIPWPLSRIRRTYLCTHLHALAHTPSKNADYVFLMSYVLRRSPSTRDPLARSPFIIKAPLQKSRLF